MRRLIGFIRGRTEAAHPPLTDEPEHPPFRCLVMAIFEANNRPCYYLCLPYRGVFRGYPWLVGFEAVMAVENFD